MKPPLLFQPTRMIMFMCMFISTLFLNFSVFAQQTVTGKVTGSEGKPLAGASVTVRGNTARGSTTDGQGVFSLSVTKGETLDISMIGFKTLAVTITDEMNYNVKLEQEI